jgi:hypothetical protein
MFPVPAKTGSQKSEDGVRDEEKVIPPVYRARSESLLSEIAVYRPGTPTQPEENTRRKRTRSPRISSSPDDAGIEESEVLPPFTDSQLTEESAHDRREASLPVNSRNPPPLRTSSLADNSFLPTQERRSSQESTWATSDGEGLFVSEERRPRVVLPEGSVVGQGSGNSLPTPQSGSPCPDIRRTVADLPTTKPRKVRPYRKRKDRESLRDSTSPPPPQGPKKKKRKAEVKKASSRN